jgi:hypothetical protein
MGRQIMGQHEAGKHSKAGKAKAAAQPRVPKSKKKATGGAAGTVYGGGKKPGILGAIFGKRKK